MPVKHFCDPDKERYWREIITRFQNTDLSGAQFCRQQGIKYSLFSDWRQRLRRLDRVPQEVRPQTGNIDWLSVIKAARSYPAGVATYCHDNGIDQKMYYRRFRKLKMHHPEWTGLTRGGRRRGSKNVPKSQNKEPDRKPQPEAEFSELRVIDTPLSPTNSLIEVVLSNSIVLRVSNDCSLEFLPKLIRSLECN